jgi:hypothetical protein
VCGRAPSPLDSVHHVTGFHPFRPGAFGDIACIPCDSVTTILTKCTLALIVAVQRSL